MTDREDMLPPRTLFLQHEQRRFYWEEPGHAELYLPMVHSGLLGEVRTIPYQRDIRWLCRVVASESASPAEILLNANRAYFLNLDEVLREFRPDLVVYSVTWPHQAVLPEILERLKTRYKFRLFSVIWDYDEASCELIEFDRGVIAVSDLVGVADSSWRVDRIRNRVGPYADYVNTGVVEFMPTVADPAIYRSSAVKRHDVTLAGSSEGARIDIHRALVDAGVPVNRVGGLMRGDRFLALEDYARALSESRIVVNTQTRGERIQLKGRVAQVLASGAFLLEQDNPEARSFLDGLGVEIWNTVDDLVARIGYWLANDAEREARAAETRRLYIERHNPKGYTRRVLERTGFR